MTTEAPNPAEAKPAEVVTPPPVQDPAKAPDGATPDPKPAEGAPPVVEPPKPDDTSQSKPDGAPAAIELKVPENSLLSQAHIDALKSYAKEKGLTNEQAQVHLEREHNAVKVGIEVMNQKAQAQSKAWLAEAQADKEIGGDKFAENVETANHALDTLFPGMDIRKFMDTTGFGNHPTILKGFVKIGKMLQPDKFNQPKGTPPIKKDAVKTMYDHPTSQQKL